MIRANSSSAAATCPAGAALQQQAIMTPRSRARSRRRADQAKRSRDTDPPVNHHRAARMPAKNSRPHDPKRIAAPVAQPMTSGFPRYEQTDSNKRWQSSLAHHKEFISHGQLHKLQCSSATHWRRPRRSPISDGHGPVLPCGHLRGGPPSLLQM